MAKVSVLVVDDATFIRDLVKKGLRDNFPGIQIEEAINGRKAQQLLGRQAVDLILCDWEMPELSGLELLTWCRAEEAHKITPFIMVTSRGDKENVVQAIQAGVSDYIGKPFSTEQLVTKVKKALHRAGKLQALMSSAPPKMLSTGAFANDSLSALTGGNAEVVKPAAKPAAAAAVSAFAKPTASAKPPSAASGGRGQGQLRLPGGSMDCVIKALSLKEALLVVKRGEPLPQVLESAVLDLEQGEAAETARLNGYLHAVAALEPKPDSEWLQVTFKFVDRDPQKLDYLSRLIARGSAQKHFVPGA
ncbi:DNA-binding response OmpR family regulator [Pseudomonas fluvialis]|uniref:DNA-binding response OmpR family regulator n=1 Tax=Pseudomonas fluvialis TaxID=1793966 RepID=A0A7X0BSS4_9PSED|nr:response regulator [Pseudomonas fluvialis]MBB6340604.1 DNA-binding response OmpR family regulator [Pseudomonas fluvialis]